MTGTGPGPLPESCRGCGCCCIRSVPELDVIVAAGDRVPEALTLDLDGLRWMRRRANGECAALDPLARICTIYDVRPLACRELEKGDADCLRALAAYEV